MRGFCETGELSHVTSHFCQAHLMTVSTSPEAAMTDLFQCTRPDERFMQTHSSHFHDSQRSCVPTLPTGILTSLPVLHPDVRTKMAWTFPSAAPRNWTSVPRRWRRQTAPTGRCDGLGNHFKPFKKLFKATVLWFSGIIASELVVTENLARAKLIL